MWLFQYTCMHSQTRAQQAFVCVTGCFRTCVLTQCSHMHAQTRNLIQRVTFSSTFHLIWDRPECARACWLVELMDAPNAGITRPLPCWGSQLMLVYGLSMEPPPEPQSKFEDAFIVLTCLHINCSSFDKIFTNQAEKDLPTILSTLFQPDPQS